MILFLPPPAQASFRTPYATQERLRLGPLVLPATVPRFGLLEVDVDASATYDDPFDPAEVRLDATLTLSDGRTLSIPGYFDRPFRRTLVDGAERLEPDGPTRWRLRICPTVEGECRLRVVFADRTGERVENATFRCAASPNKGFVTVGDGKYFAFPDGTSYWPLGSNLASAGPRGTLDYDEWFGNLGAHGANYARLSLSPGNATLATEIYGRAEAGKGIGQMDLANAWRLDHVLAVAREKGIYTTLVLNDSSELRQGERGGWDKAVENSDNGGPLRIWRDFWSSETMSRLYRNRLRYLVARYGADPHVFAWEFWNEVDRVTEFDPATVRDWHQRMARTLDGLDAYRHLRTTSVGALLGMRTIDLIPELDLMQTHAVGNADPAVATAAQQSRKSAWGKPHFVGVVAPDGASPHAEDDPEGLQAHDPIWASLATGASGGAAPLWGSSVPASAYDGPSRFLAGVDWGQERFRQTDVVLSPANPKAPVPNGDLVLEDGPVVTNPQMATVSKGVLSGAFPSSVLHGIVNHADLHNPFMLRVRVDRPTRFEVAVRTVSGEGGAKLSVNLDGVVVLDKDFPDPDWKTKTDDLSQYARVFPITLSPGVHTVVVENKGVDWVRVGYRLVGVVPRTKTPLSAWAVVGDGTVMAWLRVSDRSWRAVIEQKRNPAPAPPTVMRLRGLRSGTWRTEIWDTWAGRPVSTVRTKVGIDGGVRVALPTIERDVAVKLVREGA